MSVTLKGIDGALEIVGGALLLVLSPRSIDHLARTLTQHELSQDPHDVIARHVLQATSRLGHGTTVYAGIYLLSHGLAKVAVVIAVLRDRLWAYPAMIALLGAFILYQLYRLASEVTIGLTLLTIFDAFVVWLTWREYHAKRDAPRGSCNLWLHEPVPMCYRWLHIGRGRWSRVRTTEYEIERDILIEAPVEVVWRTVTEPDQMTLWFADKVDLEVRPGAQGYMGFGEQGGPVVVEAVEPPTRFSFRWNHPAGEEPTPTNSLLVEFTLFPEGDHTRLRVSERALGAIDRPDIDKAQYAEEHNHGWGDFLDRLAGLHADAA